MPVDHDPDDVDSGNSNLKKMLIFGGVVVVIGVLFFGAIIVAIVLKGDSEKSSRYPTTRPMMYYTAPRN